MSYIKAELSFAPGYSSAGQTVQAALAQLCQQHCKRAKWAIGAPGEAEVKPHVTLLFYGHAGDTSIKAAAAALGLEKMSFQATVKEVNMIHVDTADQKVDVVILMLDCVPIQHAHGAVKAAVEAATGKKSQGHPHRGPDGKTVYLNDFNPHISLAHYETQDKMVADFPALAAAAQSLVGAPLVLDNVHLVYKEPRPVPVPAAAPAAAAK